MRIIYLCQYFTTPSSAGSSRAFEFARRLVARGHQVDVLTMCPPGREDTDARPGRWSVTWEAGIRVHWCTIDYANTMSYPRRLRAFAEYAVRARRRVRSLPSDVVLASSTPLTVCLPAVLGARPTRTPVVFEVRDVWPEVPIALGALPHPTARWAAYRLEAWAYRHSAHVVALSPDMSASITRRFPDVAVTVVPNSSDVDLFDVDASAGAAFRAARPWLGDRPLVVYAGTFGLVNGVTYLVQTAHAMRALDREVRFLLVGEGRELDAVRAAATELGVLGTTLFIEPPAPKTEMPALLSAADVCVSTVIDVPELAANSANKVFDAFAAARPVLINHEGWLADLLRSSGAGLVTPPTDPEAAARELAARLRDPSWTASARAAARTLADREFDRDKLFERLHTVLTRAGAPASSERRIGESSHNVNVLGASWSR